MIMAGCFIMVALVGINLKKGAHFVVNKPERPALDEKNKPSEYEKSAVTLAEENLKPKLHLTTS